MIAMIVRLRRLETRLDELGIRRGVLLVVGSAGLAAALVAGLGLGQLGSLADPAPAPAGERSDAAALQSAYWQARWAIAARDGGADRAVRRVSGLVVATRSLPLSGAEQVALRDFTTAWRAYLDGRRGGQVLRARTASAGDRASAALASLVSHGAKEATLAAETSERARSRAVALLVLCLVAGSLGALCLVRLAFGAGASLARRARSWLADAFDLRPERSAPAPRAAVGPMPAAAPAVPPTVDVRDDWWLEPAGHRSS